LPLASWAVPKWIVPRRNIAWEPVARRHALRSVQQAEPSTAVVVHAPRPAPAWPRELPITVWIAGALAMLARVVAGHWRVRMLFGRAEEIRDPLVDQTSASIGLRRAVVLKRYRCSVELRAFSRYGAAARGIRALDRGSGGALFCRMR
jgi:hypothetical protein